MREFAKFLRHYISIDAELLQRIVGVTTPYVNVTPMRLWMGLTLYVVIVEPRDIEVIVLFDTRATKMILARA